MNERIELVAQWADLTEGEATALRGGRGLDLKQAKFMIENVVGLYSLPMGIVVNCVVNGRDVLVPVVIEEPTVVAACSFGAKLVRAGGGFRAHTTEPEMIGQMQVLDVADVYSARLNLLAARDELLEEADQVRPHMRKRGGGARDLEVRVLERSAVGPMLVAHIIFDCRDAMGANTIDTICEALRPSIEQITGGRVVVRVLSNLSDLRLARVSCTVPTDALAHDGFSGEQVAQGIIEAFVFAVVDPYRAATHNKGIMNGIDGVLVATGNDWRAVEAGAHAYAARSGRYTSLSTWGRDNEGNLVGTLELPLALGILGGARRAHPTVQIALKVLGVQSACELAEIAAAVGLAQNLASLRVLGTEGVRRGHERLV